MNQTPIIVVVGCGRSGTNAVLETLRGNSILKASDVVENKQFFTSTDAYPAGYLTKCDTVYFNQKQFEAKMKSNPLIKIIWTIRDPRDMSLSKMRRGVPIQEGGDCKGYAADGSPEGCVSDIFDMLDKLKLAKSKFKSRLFVIKLEEFLKKTKFKTQEICDFLDIPFQENMLNFPGRMRNKFKKERYNKIDTSQIELWRDWRNVYDGYFLEKNIDVEEIFRLLSPAINYLTYE